MHSPLALHLAALLALASPVGPAGAAAVPPAAEPAQPAATPSQPGTAPANTPAPPATGPQAPAPNPPQPGASSPPANPAPPAMVRLEGGRFRMGALTGPTNQTVAYVRVGSFLIDPAEVTVAAYAECVRAGRCTPAASKVDWEGIGDADRARYSPACNQDRADRAGHPVNCVDWDQARRYCAFAGKRLPTEEEFEWAARNGKRGTRYPWGEDPPAERACWNGEGNDAGRGKRTGTCAVGTHPGGDSESGIHDLAGNVWEWTSSETVYGADSRGRDGTPVKVARGGGWADVDPGLVTAAVRFSDLPSRRSASIGFRCAKDR